MASETEKYNKGGQNSSDTRVARLAEKAEWQGFDNRLSRTKEKSERQGRQSIFARVTTKD